MPIADLFLLAVFGPVATKWFGILQRHVVLGSVATTTAARVAADQIIFAPVQLTCFLSSMAIMEGSDPVEKWKNAFVPAYKANLAVWPFVQGVNFAFVPLELRVLVVNVISLGEYCCETVRPCCSMSLTNPIGWNCFLSLMNSGEE
jgi:protein Mpv17